MPFFQIKRLFKILFRLIQRVELLSLYFSYILAHSNSHSLFLNMLLCCGASFNMPSFICLILASCNILVKSAIMSYELQCSTLITYSISNPSYESIYVSMPQPFWRIVFHFALIPACFYHCPFILHSLCTLALVSTVSSTE